MTIIDTSQNPEAKALFLSGQVNIAVCPQCGHGGMLSTPLVYHDPEKELLFTFVPQGAGASQAEGEKIVGELTNRVISALPAEKRKGYLLQPRSFLRMQSMVEAILEAEGITPEMLEAQQAKAELLDRLLQATSEEARKIIVEENDELIDYEFFQLLALNLELVESQDQDAVAAELLGLREQLLEWTTMGREIADQQEAIESLGEEITREGLLDKLVEAALAGSESKVEALVAFARPAIDYLFYQQLTERIEAAQKAQESDKVAKLKALRETILALTAQIDAQMEKEAQRASQFLEQILKSGDPDKELRANLEKVDELFLGVLTSALDAARRAGQSERAAQIQGVTEAVMKLIQESQPPEIQFINQLLTAGYPQETQALLAENQQRLDDEMLELMELIGDDFAKRGRLEVARRMAQIREQAQAIKAS